MTPAAQRLRLGGWSAAMGALLLASSAFALLSASGPSPMTASARTWSLFFYGHFLVLTAGGLGWLAWRSSRDGLFHGGPFIDFAVTLTGHILVSSLGKGFLPGIYLILMGARLANGRPFFKAREQLSN